MLNNIISITKKFISIKSIPENPKELDKILEFSLSYLKEYTIERFERNGSKSALIYNSKKRPKKFKVILNGHLDVIPGKKHQYIPKIKGNRLYGVGSMDMKANVVCLIMAFKEMAKKVDYPLGLQLVTDEEIGGFNGTKYQIEEGIRADFVIAGEPTNFDIVNRAKGVLWLRISTKGKTAHGAYPWRGENAIWKMNDFLNVLKKKYPNPSKEKWVTTINLSSIGATNQIYNKIPDDCFIGLDIRYIPEQAKTLLREIEKEVHLRGFEIEVLTNEPALDTNRNNKYLKILKTAGEEVIKSRIILRSAQGSSDARHYARVNCPGIEFGPVGGEIGSDDEWVDIPSLEKYYQILIKFLSLVR